MTLDQAQSWTSSSRCCRLRRHLHRQRSAPDLARSQPQRPHPKLERTGPVVNARRPCSRKLRLVTPQRHLPSRIRPRNPLEMNGSRPTNGRRLLRSSIKEPSDALSSTAHWVAALVITAARSTAVWNVVKITRGTATTELGPTLRGPHWKRPPVNGAVQPQCVMMACRHLRRPVGKRLILSRSLCLVGPS